MRVKVFICEWRRTYSGNWMGLMNAKEYMTISSIEELPQWMQERIAVLRLLEETEQSPLGMWSRSSIFIVPQPEDPKWEK